MKEVDYMLIAIIVYLIIGVIMTLCLFNDLAGMVKDENLAMKVLGFVETIIITPPLAIYYIAKGIYQKLKTKSES